MTPRKAKPVELSAGGGLWIRVAANLSRRKVTWRLFAACLGTFPVPEGAPRSLYQKAAIGFLVELWGNIAEHTADGSIAALPDAQLEQWAGWDGTPGQFAAWLRAAHLDTSTGKCREWDECAGALQTRRQADAERKRNQREREKLERDAKQLTEVDVGESAHSSTSNEGPKTEAVDLDIGALAQRLTVAANQGMSENPLIGDMFNPIVSTRGDGLETVEAFNLEGLTDWTLVARIIYTLAKKYKPQKRGDHIRSLTFFRERTITVYRQHLEREAAASTDAPGEVSIDRGPYRADTRTKSARSGAGALAAADSVGLK